MPSYDYRCKSCDYEFSQFYSSYTEHSKAKPYCPKCASTQLSHIIRRVRLLSSDEQRMEKLSDPTRLSALGGDDPRVMAKMMRELASETGEPLPTELSEITERLETGESAESIEQSMNGLGDSIS